MDLRTKLVFGLVAVSLGGLLALGTFAYTSAEGLLDARSELRLTSLAEARSEQVHAVLEGWEEVVRLVASRTQLRQSVSAWNQSQRPEESARIAQIIEDARSSSGVVDGVAVFDAQDRFVAATGIPDADLDLLQARLGLPSDTAVVFGGFTEETPARVFMAAPLMLDERRIGTVRTIISSEDLQAAADNFAGLGETGETLIAARAAGGRTRLLTNPRHAVAAASPDSSEAIGALLERAIAGEEGPVTEGLIDYRGESIWAAMRRIEAADLGLVVKFDEAEERADIQEYRDQVLGFGLSLSAFAILLGVLMGFAVTKPIHDLTTVAKRFRTGDLSARAHADREDEIGVLAAAFNEMGDELERRMALLQEYQTLFHVSRDLLCIVGTDGYFTQVNPAFERVLGWPERDFLEKPFIEFVHPDDVAATAKEYDRLQQGIPTISFENRWLMADGTYTRLHWTCQPEPETGRMYAAARPITG